MRDDTMHEIDLKMVVFCCKVNSNEEERNYFKSEIHLTTTWKRQIKSFSTHLLLPFAKFLSNWLYPIPENFASESQAFLRCLHPVLAWKSCFPLTLLLIIDSLIGLLVISYHSTLPNLLVQTLIPPTDMALLTFYSAPSRMTNTQSLRAPDMRPYAHFHYPLRPQML